MLSWVSLSHWLESHQFLLGWLATLSLLMFVGTLVVVPAIIIKLPRTYLINEHSGQPIHRDSPWYLPYLIAKNMLGIVFGLAGIAMLVLPGQGLLTLFIAMTLVSFPGKRRLIKRLLTGKRIFRTINRLRARANQPPLEMESQEPPN
jgi:hypothetical protein